MSIGLSTNDRLAIVDTTNGLQVTAFQDYQKLLDMAAYRFLQRNGGVANLAAFDKWANEIRQVIKEEIANPSN
jgi:hypothetical protein